ncbi:uncharacterized protein LOC128889647 [Hylaeus anthracinus]|uniref:uncharacterized protein LOC128876999 n=1 Tax=Hylaeus volcanicus TaxID=313075 RepID=UPI0023B7BCC6|nr:uncharacterized protein LOC128876999 [Hylaeus volcanicus]XP_054003400.1 uncharacterized protein LOC128889647 [Hylaeus anthracinus]
MFRPIVAALLVNLALLQIASAVDVSKYKNIRLEFNDKDAVPKQRLFGVGEERGRGFIGDIVVGPRLDGEYVFRRQVDFNNPTDEVETSVLNLSVSRGNIHHISARNGPNSFAVVCINSSNAGSPGSSVSIRLAPQSRASLTLTVAVK